MYAAAVGADRKIYFGGRWIRNGACGGLAWYDPETELVKGLWKPLSNYQVTHMTTVKEGRIIVVSTQSVEDHVLKKAKPKQGALFLFDTKKEAFAGKIEPVWHAKGTGPVVGIGPSCVLGWTAHPYDEKTSILYAVNIDSPEEPMFKKVLPFPLPITIGSNQRETWDFRLGPDGNVWTFMERVLERINPDDKSIHVVGDLACTGRITFSDSRVYIASGSKVKRIKYYAIQW